MRLDRKHTKRVFIGAAISLLVSGVLGVMYFSGWLSTLEQQSNGFFFQAKATAPKPDDRRENRAVIVALDEKSNREIGQRWPWARRYHADLVRQLVAAEARVIAWDVIFAEPDPDDPVFAAALRAAAAENVSVILPVIGQPERHESARPGEIIQYREFLWPVPELRQAVGELGHANVVPDEDGNVRRVPLMVGAQGEMAPALGLAAEARFLRRPSVLEGSPTADPLAAGARAIPVDVVGRMLVNFQGPPARENRVGNTFDVLSYVDVLNGRVDPARLRDKAVFIGQMYAGADSYATPVSRDGQKMFGVEIHANVFETILRAEFLDLVGIPETLFSIIVLAVLGGLILPHLRPLWATLVMALLLAGYYGLSFAAFDNGVLFNMLYPPLAVVVTFVAMLLYRIVFEESEKRLIQAALGSYTSKQVMDAVLRNPSLLKLGGEKREMTVLFSDIRGFTSISERLDPQALVHLLNYYLTAMTDIVFTYEGVLDKYMGDAIMAFWGAPIVLKDHARLACLTALEMMRTLRGMQATWEAAGVPRLEIGIGINTGQMSVGNMGSRTRFDYTVMGDAVNLGARLEGLNKEYGTNIIISEFTEAVVRGQFATRPIDVVAVKGRSEPVAVFELMAVAGGLAPDQERLIDVYNQGYALYRERRWMDARQRFDQALAIDPTDGPSRLYADRCRDLEDDPPPVDWDGVYVLKHK
ncbi:MAG TPA: adenylate/guanylate cyclase domain-containing protein [Dehalococcoidia bacterium]|nr:adenylate/guanylate cyclase domain-containing protein [Dehalococcoidia bacterium]